MIGALAVYAIGGVLSTLSYDILVANNPQLGLSSSSTCSFQDYSLGLVCDGWYSNKRVIR